MSKYKTTVQPADRNPEFEVVVEYAAHKVDDGGREYPSSPAYLEIISVMHGAIDIEQYLSDEQMAWIEQGIESKITGQAAADEQDHWDNVRKDRNLERAHDYELLTTKEDHE
jgi:hypothetical protein